MSPADGDVGAGGASNATLRPGSSQRLTLHLGVLVQPYRSKSAKARAMTTADVAEILEAKYELFTVFHLVKETFIGQEVAESLAGALESLMMGHAVDPWGSATQAINQSFRDFINSREAERSGIPGTPTKAAIAGVNHRLKHPYRKSNPQRPSFRDTGMLVNSFRSWID